MFISRRRFKAVLAALAAVAALTAVSVSSASATTWTPTGKIGFSGTLKINDHTCEFPLGSGQATTYANGKLQGMIVTYWCTPTPGPVYLFLTGEAAGPTGGYRLKIAANLSGTPSPWGYMTQSDFEVPFTNGSALIPSKITFSNTQIGFAGSTVKVTGTLNVVSEGGGLVTLK